MGSEYVRLGKPENVFGQKNLLQAQINMLQIRKFCSNYEEIRKEEMLLKIALKTKIEEVKENLNILTKSLPKVKENVLEEEKEVKTISHRKGSLEEEIEMLRQKISSLK